MAWRKRRIRRKLKKRRRRRNNEGGGGGGGGIINRVKIAGVAKAGGVYSLRVATYAIKAKINNGSSNNGSSGMRIAIIKHRKHQQRRGIVMAKAEKQ